MMLSSLTPSARPADPVWPEVTNVPPRMLTGPAWCMSVLNWNRCWPSSVFTDQPDSVKATPRMSASVYGWTPSMIPIVCNSSSSRP